MTRLPSVGLGLAVLAGTALSCSLLVGGEPEPMRCSQEGQAGPPACDVGWTCQGGVCRAISGAGGGSEGGGAPDGHGGDDAGGRAAASEG